MNAKHHIPPKRSFWKTLFFILSLIFFAISAFFFWLFYECGYRHEFNELGRCYDVETDMVYTTAGLFWSLPALCFLVLGLYMIVFSKR